MESRIWNEIDKYLIEIFEGELPFMQMVQSQVEQTAAQPEQATVMQTASEVPFPVTEGSTSTVKIDPNKNLDEIKRKYIVGKISGKEIRDRAGNIIVHQNEIISNEMVELADQNGKLVELIVHMTIQL